MKLLGRLLFWGAWPLLWFVMPLTRRVRIIIRRGDDVLAVKNWIGPNIWDLPGGGIKFGESIEQAAERELKEELRLVGQSPKRIGKEVYIRKFCGLTMRTHFVEMKIGNEDLPIKNWEISEVTWMHPKDFPTQLIPRTIFDDRTKK